MNTKLSIITLTLNSEKTLGHTLQSVAEQEHTDFDIEHIIVDGGSTDDTFKIIDKYKNIKLLHCSKKGIYPALNQGIQQCTGTITGILHSDDFFAHTKVLSTVMAAFKNHNCDATYSDLHYVSATNNNTIVRKWHSGTFSAKSLKYGWMPPHPTFFARKNIFDKYGYYNEKYTISSDYELMLRFLSKNINLHYINEVLVNMRIGGASNKSVKNILTKMQEDYLALKTNNIGNAASVVFKNLRKIPQLF